LAILLSHQPPETQDDTGGGPVLGTVEILVNPHRYGQLENGPSGEEILDACGEEEKVLSLPKNPSSKPGLPFKASLNLLSRVEKLSLL